MSVKQFHKSPPNHHFYRWYAYHVQSWVVYGIGLPTLLCLNTRGAAMPSQISTCTLFCCARSCAAAYDEEKGATRGKNKLFQGQNMLEKGLDI